MLKYLTYLSLICAILSCNDSNQKNKEFSDQGFRVAKVFDKDKNLTREYEINDENKKSGFYKEYYKQGEIKYHFNYKNDSLNGEQQSYFENGKAMSIAFYKNNKIDSSQKWFYENGIAKSELFWLDGKQFGVQKEFDSIGALKDIYFTTGCDNCTSVILDFDKKGEIVNKEGNLIKCIYKIQPLGSFDSLSAIFYVTIPPLYSYKCSLIEKNNSRVISRNDCMLEEINNNKGVLFQKQIKKSEKFKIGLKVILTNESFNSVFVDSLFLDS